jgi:hypothetical protein
MAIQPLIRSVNGNSKQSAKPQHMYEIRNKITGGTEKTGVSGQPLNKNGTSPRANRQVNEQNKAAKSEVYEAEVIVKDINSRSAILQAEEANSNALRSQGQPMTLHQKP